MTAAATIDWGGLLVATGEVSILPPTGVGVECLDSVDSGGVDDADSLLWPTGLIAASTTTTPGHDFCGGRRRQQQLSPAHKSTISLYNTTETAH